MEFADFLMIVGWLSVALISWIGRRFRRIDEAHGTRTPRLFEDPIYRGYLLHRHIRAMPGGAIFALIVLGATIMTGLACLLWMHNWTRFTFLNFQIFVFGFFALMAWCLFTKKINFWGNQRFAKMLSIPMAVLCTAVCVFFVYETIGDLAWPRTIIEGQVTDKYHRPGSSKSMSKYTVTINGREYQTTRNVYRRISVDRRTKAALGAASQVIFETSPL